MSPNNADRSAAIEAIVSRFEVAWGSGKPPAIEDFLRDAGPLRRDALQRILLIDLEFRLKAGMAVGVELYLKAFPVLGEDRAFVVSLIVAEYRIRSRSNPNEEPQDYLNRFPQYRELLASELTRQKPVVGAVPENETIAFSETTRPGDLASSPRLARGTLPADVAVLLDLLQELQILPGQQSPELAQAISGAPDAPTLIGEMERLGLLSAYQADLLRKNRTKQLVFSSYVLIEPLGKGGMGQVFKARHRVMKRQVALKIIRKGKLHAMVKATSAQLRAMDVASNGNWGGFHHRQGPREYRLLQGARG